MGVMVMQLVGQGNKYKGKEYSLNDSVSSLLPRQIGLKDDWYGGMVKRMYLTKDKVYLCCDGKDNIINIYAPKPEEVDPNLNDIEDQVIDAKGQKVVDIAGIPVKVKKYNRGKVIDMAKELGIDGKIATVKTSVLIDLIKEKGGNIEKLV